MAMTADAVAVGYQVLPMSEIISGWGIPLLIVLIAFIIVKGVALYKSARLQEKGWFWVMLIINLGGILPIYYLYTRRKKKI